MLAAPTHDRLVRSLRYMLDENEFLSPYGLRSVSRVHRDKPYVFVAGHEEHRVDYVPGEGTSYLFGGNSNWRGPIWFPINYLIIEALERYHHFYGDKLKVECPVGSGKMLTLQEVAQELSRRLSSIFLPDENGERPCHGGVKKYSADPHWRDLVLFHEYFHGETGRGLGASHQTGWTALAARLLENAIENPDRIEHTHEADGGDASDIGGAAGTKRVRHAGRAALVFELECIDRMYLNLYVPQLASAPGVAAYFRGYKGHRFASTKEAVAMSERFRRQVLDFAERKATPIIRFEKGMRKDDVMHKRLRKFKAREGVVFIGIAQEKARVPRTIRKGFGEGEGTIPWIDYTTAMVNHYYFYCVDEDFGAFFIKFCSYFPYTGKLCIKRARVSQGATGPARHRIRSARQRALALWGPGGGAAHRGGFR